MRIRKRPPQIPPNFSLQLQNQIQSLIPSSTTTSTRREEEEEEEEEEEGEKSGLLLLHQQVGDLSCTHQNPSDLHPKHTKIQIIKEEKRLELDSSSSSSSHNTLGAQVHNNESVKDGVMNHVKKKRRAPAVLMEGSRCSRVNGRGWRCSQQTLIGYSLCEHHLGKGRLKSINSNIRSTSNDVIRNNNPRIINKNKMTKKENVDHEIKIGSTVVKARSMSSLLDDHKPVVDGDDDDLSIN